MKLIAPLSSEMSIWQSECRQVWISFQSGLIYAPARQCSFYVSRAIDRQDKPRLWSVFASWPGGMSDRLVSSHDTLNLAVNEAEDIGRQIKRAAKNPICPSKEVEREVVSQIEKSLAHSSE